MKLCSFVLSEFILVRSQGFYFPFVELNNLFKSRAFMWFGNILKFSVHLNFFKLHVNSFTVASVKVHFICAVKRRLSRILMKFLLLHFFQSSGNSCSILETAKHQDIGLPRAFSFCYQQEIESTKQTLGSRNKALPEQVWIKVGGKQQRRR